MAFNEQGVAMLSSVLNSERAIQVNIEIIRAFARYREIILNSKDLKNGLRALDEKIDRIFRYLLGLSMVHNMMKEVCSRY